MHNNLQNNNQSILQGCGNFHVWLDMDIARFSLCYYPSINSLEALLQQYPKVTILQVVQDPNEWYETLSWDLKELWPRLCQKYHPSVAFPGQLSDRALWIQFYNWHINRLREFCKQNTSWRYIEVNLDDIAVDDTATQLQEYLGVDTNCWKDSIHQPGLIQPQPNDITYPILVAALSKSGTTTIHNYFSCGLGGGTSIHTFTKNLTTKQQVPLAYCLENNIQNDQPLFHDCSYYKVYSDIQFVSKRNNDWSQGRCFFPTLPQNGGLQNFHKYYPRGTLLHVYRNASRWYQSARRYHGLLERWSVAQDCHGVPPPNSTEQTWMDFYENHTQWVRRFAREHPSLTYVEVELEDPHTPSILERVFGIPTFCWKASNVNWKAASENQR